MWFTWLIRFGYDEKDANCLKLLIHFVILPPEEALVRLGDSLVVSPGRE